MIQCPQRKDAQDLSAVRQNSSDRADRSITTARYYGRLGTGRCFAGEGVEVGIFIRMDDADFNPARGKELADIIIALLRFFRSVVRGAVENNDHSF